MPGSGHGCIGPRPIPRRYRTVHGERLLGAALTAKLQSALRIDTATEIIDCALAEGATVTLLKGISIAGQHYPAEHLRPMTDIDLLVPADAVNPIERELLRRGYRHGADTLGPDTHHAVPLRHPERNVWVELHHDLFPSLATVRRSRIYDGSPLAEHSVASEFHGRPVLRLTNELQLAYIASFWVRDLSTHRIDPSFVVPVLDAACLLGSSRHTFRLAAVDGGNRRRSCNGIAVPADGASCGGDTRPGSPRHRRAPQRPSVGRRPSRARTTPILSPAVPDRGQAIHLVQ